MCFRKKEKKKNEDLVADEVFRIPLKIKYKGLKQPDKYKAKQAISPIFGRLVKDGYTPKTFINQTGDTDIRYDAFRDVKKIDEKHLIEKYGTKYREFTNIHTNASREKYLGQKVYLGEKERFEETNNPKAILDPITSDFNNDVENNDDKSFATDPRLNAPIIEKNGSDKASFEYEYDPIPEYLKAKEDENPFETQHQTIKFEAEAEPSFKEVESSDNVIIEKPKPILSYENSERREHRLPPISIFSKSDLNLSEKPLWLLEQVDTINEVLKEFGIDGEVVGTIKGPTVTRYELSLEKGIKVKTINSIADNLKMRLKVADMRIQTPIPGKEFVGIEVPNKEPELVYFGNCINQDEFLHDSKHPLKVVLGVDIDGRYIYANIEEMPHCLVAGATNSGKSVCVNTILISLLLKNTKDDLKLILIDPKIVEFSVYNKIPHLITDKVINNPTAAAGILSKAVEIMERRYELLAKYFVKDISSYNQKVLNGEIEGKKIPYLVIVIDELADLMNVAANAVETYIQRLTQKGRAAGVHMILATQRPTTDVIKGVIKANISNRIAFKVASRVDSNVIIDEVGADNLLGRGDMLFKSNFGINRIQGAYIPNDEIFKTVEYVSSKDAADVLYTVEQLENNLEMDPKLKSQVEEAAYLLVREQEASINYLQQKLSVGFETAKKIMSSLEDLGIVSIGDSTKKREVLVDLIQLKKILGHEY